MSTIATALRQEISRLSRKEIRTSIESTRKATAQHRRQIALLKRQVVQLERQVALLSRRTLSSPTTVSSNPASRRVRFVAKGLRSQRKRLGLSANDFGALVGVSAQSIYNWEQESAYPRGEQLAKLAALRGIGKRDATRRLQQLTDAKVKVRRKA